MHQQNTGFGEIISTMEISLNNHKTLIVNWNCNIDTKNTSIRR